MARTRIRWTNLGRLAAGLGAGGVLIAVVPGLVEPAEPPPLPPDVGLTTGASGAAGVYASAPRVPNERARTTSARRSRRDEPSEERHVRTRSDRDPKPAPADPAPEAPAPPAPPAPTPAAAPAPPPPAPPSPAPPPEPAEPEPEQPEPDPPADEPADPPPPPDEPAPTGPSQFGFEH
jgi:hypothetical protein